MLNFVDLHCHTLFRVDDGARDEQIMQNMIDTAYSDGIRAICFTPHFKIYEFDSDEEIYEHQNRIKRRFDCACNYANEKYPDLKLCLGNEIMYHSDIYESLSTGKCNYLGNSSYALIEFSPESSAFEIENTIIKLLRKGVRPVIAHVERYSAFIKDFSLLVSLKEQGAILQVNSRAILKFKFGKIAKFLKMLLKKRLIDVIATDAHNNDSFSQSLSKAFNFIVKKQGYDYAKKIFHDTPFAIISDEKIF